MQQPIDAEQTKVNQQQGQRIEELAEMIACLSDTLKQVVTERDQLKDELEKLGQSTTALKRALEVTRQELKNAKH
jgi:uncharacterized coiled-coil DUF342 family protein